MLAVLLPVLSPAQRTDESIKVKVRRSEDGQVSHTEDHLPAEEGENLENLLKKYGVEDELGELKPGEEVEITIRRKSPARTDDMNITMDRDKTDVPVETMVSRAFLGVHYEMTYGDIIGGKINTVVSGTPAEKAALRPGDVITAVDGERLFILEDLARIVSRHKPGDRVMLSIIRDGKDRSYPVTLGERKEHFFAPGNFDTGSQFELNFEGMEPGTEVKAIAGRAFLGVTILRNEININGRTVSSESSDLTVAGVVANSTASEMGLRKGDVLRSLNGQSLKGYSDLTSIVANMKPGEKATVVFERDGKSMVVSGAMKEGNPDLSSTPSQLRFEEEQLDGTIFERAKTLLERQANGEGSSKVREFSIVIRMDEVSAQEAQALSEKSGQTFSANNNLPVAELSLAPNPGTGLFRVSFNLPQRGPTELRVIDINGRVVYQEMLNDFSGRFQKEFDISGRSKGIYYMQITQNGKTFSRKIVTQ
jgi:membrane-associated protease RseP (regulator of RpoE activity)